MSDPEPPPGPAVSSGNIDLVFAGEREPGGDGGGTKNPRDAFEVSKPVTHSSLR